jgi:hypothetical protein
MPIDLALRRIAWAGTAAAFLESGTDIYKGASHAASQYAPPQRREEPV